MNTPYRFESYNCATKVNATIEALKGWRSYRKFYAKKGGYMESLHPYYQARLEEAPFTAAIVFGCIVLAAVIVLIAAILK